MHRTKTQALGILGLATLAAVALTLGTIGVIRIRTGRPAPSHPVAPRSLAVDPAIATVVPESPTAAVGAIGTPAPAASDPAPMPGNGVDPGPMPPIPAPPVMPLPKKVIDLSGPTISLIEVSCLPNAHIVVDLAVGDPAGVADVSMHWTGIGINQQPIGKYIAYVKSVGANYQATIMTQETTTNALTITAVDGFNHSSSRIFTNLCN